MKSTYTAITKQDAEWWIGWIEEVPGVNAQERTKEALLKSLREILNEALRRGQGNRARELHRGKPDGMKRKALLGHLSVKDCELVREDGNHSWWRNRTSNKRSAVPRHQEAHDLLVKKICKDLGIDAP